jgi:hypothetical protein
VHSGRAGPYCAAETPGDQFRRRGALFRPRRASSWRAFVQTRTWPGASKLQTQAARKTSRPLEPWSGNAAEATVDEMFQRRRSPLSRMLRQIARWVSAGFSSVRRGSVPSSCQGLERRPVGTRAGASGLHTSSSPGSRLPYGGALIALEALRK